MATKKEIAKKKAAAALSGRRLCAICKDREPRSGRKVCDVCMGEGLKLRRRPTPARMKEKPKDSILTIDFDRHPDVLDRLREVADQELRDIQNQAIWCIRATLQTLGSAP